MTTKLGIYYPRNQKEFNNLLKERNAFVNSFDHIFDDMINSAFPNFKDLGISVTKGAYPKVNVVSRENRVDIVAELAGFTKEDISIEVEDDVLTISGKSPQVDEESGATYYLRELKRSGFTRSFKINDNVDMERVEADFNNGLLTISLPRLTEAVKAPKKVMIR